MNTLINKAPFIRFLLPLIIGIVIRYYIDSEPFILIIFVVSCLCFGCSFLPFSSGNSYRFRWMSGMGVTTFFIVLGMYVFSERNKQISWTLSEEERIYDCRITDPPVEKEKTMLCRLHVYSSVDSIHRCPVNKDITAYISKDGLSKNLMPGDGLLIKATIAPVRNAGNPEEFDYAFYLRQQGISASTFVKPSDWKPVDRSDRTPLRQKAFLYRQRLLSMYDDLHFPPEETALLSAITLGYKDTLSPELRQRFSLTGASHILSVSGLHVGIIYLVTNFLLFPLGRNKPAYRISKQCIIIVCIWIYAFITGLSPSIIRAACMISLMAFAVAINRKSVIHNTICISAFGMLLYNPYYLFDVGFQLSYSAVLSIVVLQPYLEKSIHIKHRFLKPVWSLITVSVAAQIGTFPIAAYYFHQFPNYFILTNLLVIPITYIIIVAAITLLFVQSAIGSDRIIKNILEISLETLNKGVAFIQQLPGSSIQNIRLYKIELGIIFVLICCLFLFVRTRKPGRLIAFLGCIAALLVSYHIKTYQSVNASKIVFLHQQESPGIVLMANRHHYLLSGDLNRTEYATTGLRLKYRLSAPTVLDSVFCDNRLFYKDRFLLFMGKSIFLLNDNNFAHYRTDKKLAVDYLVVGKGFSSDIEAVTRIISPKQIVLDASLPDYRYRRLKTECENAGINYYDIRKKGALIREI
ncbi:MAG: ComEC family competence protein [Candidatus Azobacteroides sp.]|nr:ComEC family competence protein [Candidatus Azobacteroides sp.]